MLLESQGIIWVICLSCHLGSMDTPNGLRVDVGHGNDPDTAACMSCAYPAKEKIFFNCHTGGTRDGYCHDTVATLEGHCRAKYLKKKRKKKITDGTSPPLIWASTLLSLCCYSSSSSSVSLLSLSLSLSLSRFPHTFYILILALFCPPIPFPM